MSRGTIRTFAVCVAYSAFDWVYLFLSEGAIGLFGSRGNGCDKADHILSARV